MAIWGVSGSDVTNCGWNTVIGGGVLLGCATTAYLVRLLASKALASAKTMQIKDKQAYMQYAQYVGVALGVGISGAAYLLIPGSRFALITDESTSKALKLGVLQTVVGVIIDNFVSKDFTTAAVVGLGGAAATRFGNLVLPVLGLVGTGLGSGFISK
jgi:hypothetical protein